MLLAKMVMTCFGVTSFFIDQKSLASVPDDICANIDLFHTPRWDYARVPIDVMNRTKGAYPRALLPHDCPSFRKSDARPVITAWPPDEIEN